MVDCIKIICSDEQRGEEREEDSEKGIQALKTGEHKIAPNEMQKQ